MESTLEENWSSVEKMERALEEDWIFITAEKRKWRDGLFVGDPSPSQISTEEKNGEGQCISRRPAKEISSAEEEEMKLWSSLPYDLLMRVLAFLPVHKVTQLQVVCKSWNALPRSPAFLRMSSEVARCESWLVMERWAYKLEKMDRELIAFCPTLNRWFQLPLDMMGHPLLVFSEMSSAGGLICCLYGPLDTVFVFNLLTRAIKKLTAPPLPDPDTEDEHLAMVANPATGSYQVIRFLSTEPYNGPCKISDYMQVYDSRSESWNCKLCRSQNFTGDVLDGDLFELDREEDVLIAYNAEQDVWSKVKAPVPTCTATDGASLKLVHETVTKCKGRLVLAAGLEVVGSQPTLQGFGVWELRLSQGTGIWVELSRTPRQFWEGLHQWQYELNFSVANQNLVCMTGMEYTTDPDEEEDDEGYWHPLVYDLALDSWQRLPCYGDKVHYVGLFTFQPRWNATV